MFTNKNEEATMMENLENTYVSVFDALVTCVCIAAMVGVCIAAAYVIPYITFALGDKVLALLISGIIVLVALRIELFLINISMIFAEGICLN